MVEQVQETMSNIEQYRMAMKIITMWDAYRMPAIYIFGGLLALTIVLFVMKSCWKKTVLFLTILAGLTIVAFDGFKMYVEYKKKEATSAMVASVANVVESAVTIPVKGAAGVAETVKEGIAGLIK